MKQRQADIIDREEDRQIDIDRERVINRKRGRERERDRQRDRERVKAAGGSRQNFCLEI